MYIQILFKEMTWYSLSGLVHGALQRSSSSFFGSTGSSSALEDIMLSKMLEDKRDFFTAAKYTNILPIN